MQVQQPPLSTPGTPRRSRPCQADACTAARHAVSVRRVRGLLWPAGQRRAGVSSLCACMGNAHAMHRVCPFDAGWLCKMPQAYRKLARSPLHDAPGRSAACHVGQRTPGARSSADRINRPTPHGTPRARALAHPPTGVPTGSGQLNSLAAAESAPACGQGPHSSTLNATIGVDCARSMQLNGILATAGGGPH